MVFLNLGLSLALVGPMGERGIALANSATGLATFVALNVLLARRFPGIELRPAYRALLRTALAAVLMGAAAWGASRLMGGVGGATIAAKLARALVPVAAGVATYALLARLLLKDELGLLLRRAHDDRRVPAPDPQDLPRPRPETGPG
jgi:putative peptidoglycan lipid II flippase